MRRFAEATSFWARYRPAVGPAQPKQYQPVLQSSDRTVPNPVHSILARKASSNPPFRPCDKERRAPLISRGRLNTYKGRVRSFLSLHERHWLSMTEHLLPSEKQSVAIRGLARGQRETLSSWSQVAVMPIRSREPPRCCARWLDSIRRLLEVDFA